jgi:hypothetical protein
MVRHRVRVTIEYDLDLEEGEGATARDVQREAEYWEQAIVDYQGMVGALASPTIKAEIV